MSHLLIVLHSITRQKINTLIEHWSRLCLIIERTLRRREAAAADLARATLTLNALVEADQGADPWALPDSELASGVRTGLENVSRYLGQYADLMETRVRTDLLMVSETVY